MYWNASFWVILLVVWKMNMEHVFSLCYLLLQNCQPDLAVYWKWKAVQCFVSFCFSLPVDIIVKETCPLCIDQYLSTWMIECIDMLPFGSLENEWDIIVKETCHLCIIDKHLSTWMIEYIDMLPICSLENEYGALTCFLLVVWKMNTCFLLVVRKMNMEHGLFDWEKKPFVNFVLQNCHTYCSRCISLLH
jgi:hypothetical protein